MALPLSTCILNHAGGLFLPTGAPKAAETPAAAPADTKSLFSVSLRKYSNICKHKEQRCIYDVTLNALMTNSFG